VRRARLAASAVRASQFGHLTERPIQRTYLPTGINENEPKRLPTRPSDEDAGEEEKLKTRGLTAFPFAQNVDADSGRRIIAECGDDAYAFERENGTYGLAQIWPIKANEQFYKKFTCSTGANPEPKVFQPQAIVEFEHAICKLFGDDATRRCPIIFAKNVNVNTKPVYRGSALAIEKYLRAHPEVCHQLKLAKLYPGGFVAVVSVGSKNGLKHFDFQAGKEYCLYTKVGYESMACIKTADIFESECALGKELSQEEHLLAINPVAKKRRASVKEPLPSPNRLPPPARSGEAVYSA
jgi:hypothetical protein